MPGGLSALRAASSSATSSTHSTYYYVHHFVPKTYFGKRLREQHTCHHFQDHRTATASPRLSGTWSSYLPRKRNGSPDSGALYAVHRHIRRTGSRRWSCGRVISNSKRATTWTTPTPASSSRSPSARPPPASGAPYMAMDRIKRTEIRSAVALARQGGGRPHPRSARRRRSRSGGPGSGGACAARAGACRSLGLGDEVVHVVVRVVVEEVAEDEAAEERDRRPRAKNQR